MPPGGEQRARSFYGELLGLDEVRKPAHLQARGGCWFRTPFGGPPVRGAGRGVSALELHLGVEEEFRPARKAHVAFAVRGLAPLRERLRQSGVAIVDDAPLEGFQRFYIHDPFGNRLELIEELPA